MWINVLSANLTGGCCGAVIPPILDLAMAGKGSLGVIFVELVAIVSVIVVVMLKMVVEV
jgi:hypothetical protein